MGRQVQQIILHHYPESPVSEKVRVVLGLKNLAWRSVRVPRMPPKPLLEPLTGGYRQTPVMQIGADIYCDSQCIIRELERRFPEPTLYPGGGDGMVWAVSRWTDEIVFKLAITLVLGVEIGSMPEAFIRDRVSLYFGPEASIESLESDIPRALAQLRAHLGWVEQRLATGRAFMLGDRPGLPDALCYYIVWFLRGRYHEADRFLTQFPALCAWERRMCEIGHGSAESMEPEEALDIARSAEPATPESSDPGDPEALSPGLRVGVCPENCTVEVEGEIVSVSAETLAIQRYHQLVGNVVVHFPRVGYFIRRLS